MKVQKVSQSITPFAGISFVNQEFNESGLSVLIDNHLGMRSLLGYQIIEHNKYDAKPHHSKSLRSLRGYPFHITNQAIYIQLYKIIYKSWSISTAIYKHNGF